MALVEIQATPRTRIGKEGAIKIKKVGMVPAVIYGGNMEKPLHVTIDPREMIRVIEGDRKCKLAIEGNTYDVLVRDYQVHPVKKNLIHVDFQHLIDDRKISAMVPVNVVGTAAGMKLGARLFKAAYEVRVTCLPKDLPAMVDVEISDMLPGEVLYVNQLNYPEGVMPCFKARYPVVVLKAPRGSSTTGEK